jgi:methionyl-tRNA formyltransferase
MTTSGASTPLASRARSAVVLLGRPCDNTLTAARVLQDAGVDLAAVILADPFAPEEQLETAPGSPPRYRAQTPGATRRLLERLRPDLAIAACYPWRLSRRARAVPRLGVLNLHPSPLPHGLGPDPVFWVFRNGDRETGVTIHLMDDALDTGPILAQRRLAVPEAMDAVALERHLFESGAAMAAELLPQVLAGAATYTPQDNHAATYQPAPSPHDWMISSLLPAAWAWRFARGVAPLDGPLVVQAGGQVIPVRNALSWGEHGDPPADLPPRTIAVRFRPGWVLFEQ